MEKNNSKSLNVHGNGFSASYNIDDNPNPSSFYMHVHENYEILYFIRGKAKFLVEGSSYDLKPGNLVIMRPSESHKIELISSEPYERVAIHISPAIFHNADTALLAPFNDRRLGMCNLYRKDDFETLHYRSCLDTVIRLTKKNSSSAFIIGNIVSLLGEIYNSFASRIAELPVYKSEEVTVKVVEYVNEHLFENISLESVSRDFFMSVSQINRIFKKATGSTLWDYVIIKRLLAARESIFQGMNACDAASKSGFSDYSSFYRAYKKKFGCSPKNSTEFFKNF